MARHLRIPGLLDLFTADEAASIRSLDSHPRIDRVFDKEGPLATRALRARIRNVFHIDGRLWPAFLPRGDERRQKRQRRPERPPERPGAAPRLRREALDRLADLLVVAGGRSPDDRRGDAAGVGRAFQPAFHATRETYDAADVLANWPQAKPFRALVAAALRQAAARARDDPRGGEERSLLRARDLARAAEHDRELRAHARAPADARRPGADPLRRRGGALAPRPEDADPRRAAARAAARSAPRAPPPEREDRRAGDDEAASPRRHRPLRPRRGADRRPAARLQRGKLVGLPGARMGAGAVHGDLAALASARAKR